MDGTLIHDLMIQEKRLKSCIFGTHDTGFKEHNARRCGIAYSGVSVLFFFSAK